MKDTISITWKGETKEYSDSSLLSPKMKAFMRFAHQNKDDEFIKLLGEHVRLLLGNTYFDSRVYEKPLFGYDCRTKTSPERMNTTVADAEAMLNKLLRPYHDHMKDFPISMVISNVEKTYDPEYDDPTEFDLVCDNIRNIIGWKIYGDPWSSNLIDDQRMSVAMHREKNGSLRYNWYAQFKHPDFLVDHINLDEMYDKASRKVRIRGLDLDGNHIMDIFGGKLEDFSIRMDPDSQTVIVDAKIIPKEL